MEWLNFEEGGILNQFFFRSATWMLYTRDMKLFFFTLFLSLGCMVHGAQYQGPQSPDEGFQRLMEGNQRFVDGKLLHPNRDQERRDLTAIAQKPFAIVLSCSDSRVSPEILFDAGIGDLFVVRLAGNVVGPIGIASIGYSALYLGSNVLFVLGHQDCGAVKAVLDGTIKDILPIAALIEPAVKEAKTQSGPTLDNAIKDNVRNVVALLQKTPLFADLMKKKKLLIVGGYYDLTSGKVKVLSDAPDVSKK